MGQRSFEEAAIAATGSQTLEHRFGKRRRAIDLDHDTPSIRPWRCNLTGLSQVHNLYFVAYTHEIYVYVPQFPTQQLPSTPALIVTSQPSGPGFQGYLDLRHPHAINHLVVQNLGNEEVVAAVRDDGDVDAFLVRHIVQAIERRGEPDSGMGLDADEVKPIFQSNVGMSAWGLAIHSEARIIATSANTHNITIFKFGLVETDQDEAMREDGDDDDEVSNTTQDRGMDVTHSVLNGTSNIPYIAFCNTGDDPSARWLLTSDISGYCRTIDLHEMQSSQTFRFGRPQSYLASSSHDRFNSGWAIMFLDRRSFIPEDDFYAALGLDEGEALPGSYDSRGGKIWDIGATVSHVPCISDSFSAKKQKRTSPASRPAASSTASTRGVEQSPESGSDPMPASEEMDQGFEDILDDALQHIVTQDDLDAALGSTEGGESDSDQSEYYADIDLELDDEGTEDTVSFSAMYGGRRICGNEPRGFQSHNNLCGDCPCPILHASVRSVYLLQPSNKRTSLRSDPFTAPTVGFTNALHQLVQGEFAYLNVFERLNMNAYIPAIGIVILGSQKGRAVILSLTKMTKRSRLPKEILTSGVEYPDTTYAMRIERILPFAHQEEQQLRPFAPLAGMSTGPVQGTEHLPDDKKRWRLLMMYSDHTVLSYEIRRRHARDSGVDIQGVIV
ncbi:hypothetical protein DOTSEDRAFT_69718 [Lecanosticta acicola]|uniref:Uncharacterized protein n=1 Tax=Lecanosticta acicola TaxID=111012 RepID=A0AAI9EDP5_9PEZI|nr:hypothetical protein DOTSEDRAFT_69718 [Lecanosticta acicola]